MEKRGAHDLLLEKIALGEAIPTAPLSPEDQARVQALRDENAQILARYPAAPQAEQIAARVEKARAQAQPQHRKMMWLPAVASAAAVLSIVVWVVRPQPGSGPQGGDEGDVIREKGSGKTGQPHLLVYRQRDGRTEAITDGGSAQAGDLLQLAFVPGKARYGVLLSIDGRGGVTLHYPDAGAALPRLLPDDTAGPGGVTREVRLPRSFRLDDAPSFERFFLITTDEAGRAQLQVDSVVTQARRLAQDSGRAQREALADLPAGVTQTSLLLRKDGR